MKQKVYILFLIFSMKLISQESAELIPGDKAPSFLLNLQQNTVQSFSMPYLNRFVLIHFWSSSVTRSKVYNKHLNRFTGRYKSALYRSAEGFETIAIAVQSDKNAWNELIAKDTLSNFINGIASRGYSDEVCKKFNVKKVPYDILVDETGIIIAVNPSMYLLEDILDQRKNFLPVKKDVIGTLALYTSKGEKILEGKTFEKGFVFNIPSKLSYLLTEDSEHSTLGGGINQVDVVKDLIFKNNGNELTPKDEQELNSIYLILEKNKSLSVEVITHTDTKLNENDAMELTNRQSVTIKNYFLKKGLSANRLKMVSKGNTQTRKKCSSPAECSEDEHRQNRRSEFIVFKS